ncbi:MAG: hypothetical protein KAS36_14730, partial [Anaerolineales bacterium]|nr:hypothetical protein [Anaerolineales bacterium]
MPNTSINCPNCRQRIVADVDQLFDVEPDPTAKQKLLSGAFNIIQCPHCGFNGNLATPIVYHDHEKELLLTYVPAEVNLPRDEQERVIGTIINQVVSQLPQEQRKGYLLQPQSFLNMQSMVERILEADGITHEMIEAQQQRLNLLQRLLDVSDDSLADVAEQEDDLLDAEFFLLLNSLLEASMLGNDQESAQRLGDLQQKLMPITTFGQQVQEQTKEVEAAVESLREAGEELTREKLLDLVITAPNETRLNALVSLARPGMDYEFFSMLSARIDRARGDGRTRLIELREHLLEMTQAVDQQMEARANQAQQLLNSLLQAENIEEAMLQSLPAIDEFFIHELDAALETARKEGDLEKSAKLKGMQDI